MTHLNI